MKKMTAAATRKSGGTPGKSSPAKIHPVIVYPFAPPKDFSNLEELYRLVARLDKDRNTYARPITVMDRKTLEVKSPNPRFQKFRSGVVARHSDILDAWCVDTCQMWYTGLGAACDRGSVNDVYWLIPGDFNYGSPIGQEVLGRLHDLPEICAELRQDICIGEIATDHNHPKQLIDTYGTFALLYNWFPGAAQEIRQFTERPRSEFFALRGDFLRELLHQRWYAYEQTVVMLLEAVRTRRQISRFFVGNICDLPAGRESMTAAMQQVERAERVLKSVWRARHEHHANWFETFQQLELRSEQIRHAAITVLHNLLTGNPAGKRE